MARHNPIQTNFTAGELSPRLSGRVDVSRYFNGVAKLQNFIVMPQGGAYRRPPTHFVREVKTSSKKTRVVEFQFSEEQAYILEFGHQYVRVYKDEGRIEEDGVLAGVTITSGGSGYTNGETADITNAGGSNAIGTLTVNTGAVTGITITDGDEGFTVSENLTVTGRTSSSSNATVSVATVSDNVPVEISTPYLEADLFKLYFNQSADVLYIYHPNYWTRKLTRSSHVEWTLAEMDFQDGPYLDENTTTTTLTPSATSGSVTITASSETGINDGDGFQTTDVGRLIRFKDDAGNWAWMKITARSTTKIVTASIQDSATLSNTNPSEDWRLGAWSDTTGFPSCGTFFEERHCLSNTTTQPQTNWKSRTGMYEDFSPSKTDGTVEDDHGITYAIASNQVNAVRWLASGRALLIGTSGGEWNVTIAEPITPSNIQVQEQSTYGSAALQPKRTGTEVLYIQRSGRKLRNLIYNFEVDGFASRELSLLSEHLLRQGGGVVDAALQNEPDHVYWMALADGRLIGMTYLPEQDVIAFHQHIIGGSFGNGHSVVESVACVPSPNGDGDQLWMVVKRTINGSTKRYIEFMEEPFEPADDQDKDDMVFMDSFLTYDGAAATTISGLGHLEGETVEICADGAERPSSTVNASGQITLDRSAERVHVGLSYTSVIKTLRPEGSGNAGTAQGKKKRYSGTSIRVLNSLHCKVGLTEETVKPLVFRKTADKMGVSPPLYSGDKEISLDMPYETDGSYVVLQDKPYPLTVLALMAEGVVYE